MRTGVLLANLGTPDDITTHAVRRYLAEFLMDPYVVDILPPLRFALVYGLILPTRPAKSRDAYQKIWTDRGSPLLSHSQDLTEKCRAFLRDHAIALGMRYGKPSLRNGLEELRAAGVDRVVALPLYPQYSLAATESSIQKIKSELDRMKWSPEISFVPAFYDHPAFVRAFTERVRPLLDEKKPDFVLFSFHGVPERHVRKTDPTGAHCLASAACCDKITAANRDCYRAQSFATARAIAKDLNLSPEKYSISFQSRLGRTPWIKPYTDLVMPELVARGFRRILVVCPSFVADCLETLEEIEIRGRADFKRAGGEELFMAPSLNSSEAWVQAIAELVQSP